LFVNNSYNLSYFLLVTLGLIFSIEIVVEFIMNYNLKLLIINVKRKGGPSILPSNAEILNIPGFF